MLDLLFEIISWRYRKQEQKDKAAGKKVGITFMQYIWIYTFLAAILISIAVILYQAYVK